MVFLFHVDLQTDSYCLCGEGEYGLMVACDAENCPIEWYHADFVGLEVVPEGYWYCPQCEPI